MPSSELIWIMRPLFCRRITGSTRVGHQAFQTGGVQCGNVFFLPHRGEHAIAARVQTERQAATDAAGTASDENGFLLHVKGTSKYAFAQNRLPQRRKGRKENILVFQEEKRYAR